MNNKLLLSQRGMSLIEVLIVLALMAIIVGFAIAQFGKSNNNLQRQNISRELKISFERARFDSVKRRPETDGQMSRVVIESATSFSVYLDLNQDGIVNPNTEKKKVDFTDMGGVKIVGSNLEFPITVKFDRRGHVTVDGDGNLISSPFFIVCDKDCTLETADNGNSNRINISSTGTISMTGGAESGTIFGNPTLSNVSPCDQINSWVTVSNSLNSVPDCKNTPTPATPTPSTSPSPTPTPTPSSSATPTPAPKPSATPTPPPPTPTPTPSATPTPNACTSGQKPSQSNCTCYLPMTVRTNGKCM